MWKRAQYLTLFQEEEYANTCTNQLSLLHQKRHFVIFTQNICASPTAIFGTYSSDGTTELNALVPSK